MQLLFNFVKFFITTRFYLHCNFVNQLSQRLASVVNRKEQKDRAVVFIKVLLVAKVFIECDENIEVPGGEKRQQFAVLFAELPHVANGKDLERFPKICLDGTREIFIKQNFHSGISLW